ncbi:MAG: hypothetical protein J6U86_03585 [Clostridia bacterium]|nr:hypothetical protein [Clostridia bacterium]
MSYFKRFGDFCSGFAAFAGVIYLISRFISADYGEEPLTLVEKIKLFFDKDMLPMYYLMMILTVSFLLSVVFGRIFARASFISIFFCIPPVIISVCFHTMQVIEERPMLYIVLSLVAFVSAVVDCILSDRANGKHRAAYAGSVVSLAFSAYCILLARKYSELVAVSGDEEYVMWVFESHLLKGGTDIDVKMLYVLAAVYASLAVISFILRDIYFIDAVLAIPPAVYLIYTWGAGRLLVIPETIVTFAVLVFVARIVPAISSRAGKTIKGASGS